MKTKIPSPMIIYYSILIYIFLWQYSELLKLNVESFQQKIWKYLSNPENCTSLTKSQNSGKPVIPRKSRMKHAVLFEMFEATFISDDLVSLPWSYFEWWRLAV